MRLFRPAWLLTMALLGARGAAAQAVEGADLARELSGNTLSGFNGSLWFSEHHLPDGRVFGHNGGVPVQDGCWTVRGNAVCYYYPGSREPGQTVAEFCWLFQRAGSAGFKIALVGRASGGVARLEAGNPRNHTDGGRTWTCEAQTVRRDSRSASLGDRRQTAQSSIGSPGLEVGPR